MKGKLYRKTEGWMVFYVEKNSAYTSTSYQKSLPLHPDNSTVILYEKHPLDWDGKEVDFEIVNESWDGYRGCAYAKLIRPSVDKLGNEDVPKLGYDAQLPQQEISDEEIEKAARDFDNAVIYGSPLLYFEQGAKWYREQLKLKQPKKD